MVRQPSPTNAGTYRGENAGDGDKSQPSPEACLGFYKIRKKGAPGDAWTRDRRGRKRQTVGGCAREAIGWTMADSIASHQPRKIRGADESDWTMYLAGLDSGTDDR